ncbi:hypothetical protein PhCBS80983_g00480 [Powellomyces hirtus]|uniref:Ubiquitin carboxyl-terminal hydrolase n=1 Tax=Powellomyces hirtus TaxID=109895 RepID=A0A507EDY6_9FUNG|nr:hypothetical protein PhCBS80983_g00480 [Powellomyces hirtus]
MKRSSYFPSLPNYQLDLLGPNNPLGSLYSVILLNVGAAVVVAAAAFGAWKLSRGSSDASLVEALKKKRRKGSGRAESSTDDDSGWEKKGGKWWRAEDDSIMYPPGLLNLGNTCFMNSVIQALSSLPALCAYLVERCLRASRQRRPDDLHVTLAMCRLTSALNELSTSHVSLRPTDLMAALSATNPSNRRLLCYDQQDAHELLLLVSSTISAEEAKTVRPLSLLDARNSSCDRNAVKGIIYNGKRLERAPPAWIRNPLTGLSASAITCKTCRYSSGMRHETFDILSLAVPTGRRQWALEQLLNAYVAPENIHDYICDKCSLNATLKKLESDIGFQIEIINGVSVRRRKMARRQKHLEEANSPLETNFLAAQRKASSLERDLERERQKLDELEENREFLKRAIAVDVHAEFPESLKRVKIASPISQRRVMIANAPPSLCLHLQRSVYHPSGALLKNNARVVIKEFLDLGPYCTVDDNGTYLGIGVQKGQGRSFAPHGNSNNIWKGRQCSSASMAPFPIFMAATSAISSQISKKGNSSEEIPMSVRNKDETSTGKAPSTETTQRLEELGATATTEPSSQSRKSVTPNEQLAISKKPRPAKKGKKSRGSTSHYGSLTTINGVATDPSAASPSKNSVELNASTVTERDSEKGLEAEDHAEHTSDTHNKGLTINARDDQLPDLANAIQCDPAASTVNGKTMCTQSSPSFSNSMTPIPYPYLYRLAAVVIHYGSHESGHFVTYRRMHPTKERQLEEQKTGGNSPFAPPSLASFSESASSSFSGISNLDGSRWYRLSDASVELVRDFEGDVLGHGGDHAYMLFYDRVTA